MNAAKIGPIANNHKVQFNPAAAVPSAVRSKIASLSRVCPDFDAVGLQAMGFISPWGQDLLRTRLRLEEHICAHFCIRCCPCEDHHSFVAKKNSRQKAGVKIQQELTGEYKIYCQEASSRIPRDCMGLLLLARVETEGTRTQTDGGFYVLALQLGNSTRLSPINAIFAKRALITEIEHRHISLGTNTIKKT